MPAPDTGFEREGRAGGSDLYRVLREVMADRNWSMRQLAEALDMHVGVVHRWVSEDPTKRVVPQPQTCVQIAHTFNLDPTAVLIEAGYLPPMEDRPAIPNEDDIRALERRLRRVLLSVPPGYWPIAVMLTDLSLDHLQAIITRTGLRDLT
jgi:transcriptional regulator with XRE-family HTH domain